MMRFRVIAIWLLIRRFRCCADAAMLADAGYAMLIFACLCRDMPYAPLAAVIFTLVTLIALLLLLMLSCFIADAYATIFRYDDRFSPRRLLRAADAMLPPCRRHYFARFRYAIFFHATPPCRYFMPLLAAGLPPMLLPCHVRC